jgi:hypothetical protein
MVIIGSAEWEQTIEGSVGFGVTEVGGEDKVEEWLQVLRTVVLAES